jgi:puromycin-sensitive aminopeptidase
MQPGYPCVDVVPEHSGDQFSLRLSQKRFFSDPARSDQDGQVWQVPLVIRYEDGDGVHEMRSLMPARETAVQLKLSGPLKWCFANAGSIGFYRQNLHPQLLDGLLANLDRLETGEQMGLLDDQWALVRNGTQRIGQFLDVLSAMMRTRDHELLGQIVGHLQQIEGLLQDAGDEEALRRFRSWVDDALQPKLAELGFDARPGESQSEAQLRAHVVRGIAAIARNPEAIREAERRQQHEADDPAAVDPNLAPVFVQVAADAGDAPRYDSFIEIYQRRRSSGAPPQETDRYLYSFPRFRPPELVERTFEIIDEEVVPREAIFPLVRQMLGLRHARLAAWEYIKREWEKLQGIGQLAVGRLVEATGQLPVSLRDDIVAFYDTHLNGIAPTSYARALEAMDQYAEFQARTRDDLVAWFKNT